VHSVLTTGEDTRIDQRDCPRCGTRDILPLEQATSVTTRIEDPVMLCPVCSERFAVTGTTWLGAWRPPDPAVATEAEIDRWANAVADAYLHPTTDTAEIPSDRR
jgi:hypothetical protein